MENTLLHFIHSYKPTIYKYFYTPDHEYLTNVDQVFVINLKHEYVKRNYIITLFKQKKINFQLVIVEPQTTEVYNQFVKNKEITRSEFGCLVSHLYILDYIARRKINAIIFEDDIWLHKNFVEEWNTLHKIRDFDFLLLGACDFHFSKENYSRVSNKLYTMKNEKQLIYGAHANFYSHNAAKFWLTFKLNQIEFFDKHYFYLFSHFPLTSGIISPNLVLTDISYSNNGHTYPLLSLKEKEYYAKCFKQVNFHCYHIFYPLLFSQQNVLQLIHKYKSYEEIIDEVLYVCFHNAEKEKEIKSRLDLTHLTIEDIRYITQGYHK